MEEKASVADKFVSYFLGGVSVGFDELQDACVRDPELFTRSLVYALDSRKYHRVNVSKGLMVLINTPERPYRNYAWALIQKMPLSHLLAMVDLVDKKNNTRRLRFAILNKLAFADRSEIIRAYFMASSKFRKLFKYFYLPKKYCDNREITNENYLFALKLSELKENSVLSEIGISYADLVQKYGISLHRVLHMVSDPSDARDLAASASSDDFFEHARWFRMIIGDDEYIPLLKKNLNRLKNPQHFLKIKDHLVETGALPESVIPELEERAKEVMDDMLKEFNLERVALFVDVSGSMYEAIEIANNLCDSFSVSDVIKDIIAFRGYAFAVDRKKLSTLYADGSTAVGSAVVELIRRIESRSGEPPQAIIIVSDMEDWARPRLVDTLDLLREKLNSPPIIILHCGKQADFNLRDYPHARISLRSFEANMLPEIMRHIVSLSSKVAVKEKKITDVVKERRILEEVLGSYALPTRAPETFVSGYMARVLTGS